MRAVLPQALEALGAYSNSLENSFVFNSRRPVATSRQERYHHLPSSLNTPTPTPSPSSRRTDPTFAVYDPGMSLRNEAPKSSIPLRNSHTHDSSRRYVCEECGQRCPTPSALETHTRTHTRARPYICRYRGCRKDFTTSSNLKRHGATHIAQCAFEDHPRMSLRKETPEPNIPLRDSHTHDSSQRYVCEECGHCYPTPIALETHTRTHTGARSYICHYQGCRKDFTTSSNLKRHEATHTTGSAFEDHPGMSLRKETSEPNIPLRDSHTHDSSQRYVCEECGHCCATPIALEVCIYFIFISLTYL
ncbi:hypothetical protein M422DRAFT_45792 [Sphaerobolus stellatus SS14]|nr:hypothetical protein M422DRAFT_45792 [Sphaerobolus stellatus SS14]